ncbi:MAG: tRNA 5-methoxyuridine(34)/uridine 5-oxyacetic acid(34) synthase CmoB [Pseudomonadota bacterium]
MARQIIQTSIGAVRELAGEPRLSAWLGGLEDEFSGALERHGQAQQWLNAITRLPALAAAEIELAQHVKIGTARQLSHAQNGALISALEALRPWRKGPFDVFGTELDAEWRSDHKWARVARHFDCRGRKILDVGCGNGYSALRMIGAGAAVVVGIDPSVLFVLQSVALRRFFECPQLGLFVAGDDAIEKNLSAFDAVFSMGVLYHRRDPRRHLSQLGGALAPGGDLVLETLIVPDAYGDGLEPSGRYAQMRNVYFLPTDSCVRRWLADTGFSNIRCVDVNQTTVDEQRATVWMQSQSLVDFLDPDDPNKTIEGYPAPRRAIFLASLI